MNPKPNLRVICNTKQLKKHVHLEHDNNGLPANWEDCIHTELLLNKNLHRKSKKRFSDASLELGIVMLIHRCGQQQLLCHSVLQNTCGQ